MHFQSEKEEEKNNRGIPASRRKKNHTPAPCFDYTLKDTTPTDSTPENVTDRFFRSALLQKIGKHHQLLHFESATLARNGDNLDFDSVDARVDSRVIDLLSISDTSDHEVACSAHKAGSVDSNKELVLSLYQETLRYSRDNADVVVRGGDGHGQRLVSELLGCRDIDAERLGDVELRVCCDSKTRQKSFRNWFRASVLVGESWRRHVLRDVRDVR